MPKNPTTKIIDRDQKAISKEQNNNDLINNQALQTLLKAQEDFLVNQYADKDNLLAENKRLNDENAKLVRTIMIDNEYINYLLNSFWWKITIPFRIVSRKVKRKMKKDNYQFVQELSMIKDFVPVKEKVSILIFTYNAGEEFTVQLKNLSNQKLLENIEIIIIDRGSTDNTLNYARKAQAKIIYVKDNQLTNDEIYERSLSSIHGKYVVFIDQNRVIDSKYWIYQAIRPIIDDKAVSTIFFKEDVSVVKNTTYYPELKERMATIASEQVLFFPKNRNIIQYMNPALLDKSCVLVKKKTSNIFLI